MKKFLIILVLLILLAGGGAAYWHFEMVPKEPSPPPEPTYSFIELPTLPVARLKNGVPDRLFNIQIVLLFDDPEKKEKVRRVMPAILDAVIVELHNLLPRKILEQRDFDQELIRMRLEKAVTRRIGAGWIYRLSLRNLEQIQLR